jgi:protein-disulfide isomerase
MKPELRKILPLLAVLVVAAGAVAFYWVKTHPGAPGGPVAGPETGAPPAEGILAVTAEDMILGQADAPVTLIEYASLTCPHCAAFEAETLPRLQSAYIDSGKLRLVFRDFPLDPVALRAAMLAHCAGKERYFGFLQVLFQNQADWRDAQDPEAGLAAIAKLGGIGKEEFGRCMADETLAKRVVQSRHDAEKSLTIESTPTFFINGKKVSGAQPFEAFEAIIKPLLPKS